MFKAFAFLLKNSTEEIFIVYCSYSNYLTDILRLANTNLSLKKCQFIIIKQITKNGIFSKDL